MTCTRHCTPAAVADLQQIAATIEAERRRMYRAEMAAELREKLLATVAMSIRPASDEERGMQLGIKIALRKIGELSSPVVCDETE